MLKKIDEKHVQQIIHAVGVMQLASAMEMDVANKRRVDELTLISSVVITMHNGREVLADLVSEEAEKLSEIIQTLDIALDGK